MGNSKRASRGPVREREWGRAAWDGVGWQFGCFVAQPHHAGERSQFGLEESSAAVNRGQLTRCTAKMHAPPRAFNTIELHNRYSDRAILLVITCILDQVHRFAVPTWCSTPFHTFGLRPSTNHLGCIVSINTRGSDVAIY